MEISQSRQMRLNYTFILLLLGTVLCLPACDSGSNTPAIEICGNGLDDDGDGVADCDDADCSGETNCASAGREVCDDGTDDDGDGVMDCADADCNSFSDCDPNRVREVCNNGIDDDGDGLIDCADADCNSFSACYMDSIEICNNFMDEDGDSIPDCYDPDCLSFMDCENCPSSNGRPRFGAGGYTGELSVMDFPEVRIADGLLFIRNSVEDIRYMHLSNLVFTTENSQFNDATRMIDTGPISFPYFPVEGGDTLYDVSCPEGSIYMVNCLQLTLEYRNVTIGGATPGILQGVSFPLENARMITSELYMLVQ